MNSLMCFKNTDEEIRAMASWAYTGISTHPSQTVACIVPDLSRYQDRVDRILQEICGRELYALSTTHSLFQQGLVQAALHTLAIRNQDFSNARLESFFLSPYLHYRDSDRALGAAVHRQLLGESRIDPTRISMILQHNTDTAATLPQRWEALWHISIPQGTHPFKTWIDSIPPLLKAIGWPGERPLNHDELQLIAHWEKQLLTWSVIEGMTDLICDYSEALETLETLCQNTPQSEKQISDKPIQIVDWVEAQHTAYDHVWIMGFNDMTPALSLQNKCFTHSTTVLISYAEQCLNPTTLQYVETGPSPQLKEVSLLPTPVIPPVGIPCAPPLQCRTDHTGPLLTPSEKIRGGSTILSLQARCPFRAFATLRLHASRKPQREIGVSALQRGMICHAALCVFWKNIASQKALKMLNPIQQNEAITHAIEAGIVLVSQSTPLPRDYFLDIEKNRLHTLLNAWMALEKERPPFKILAVETTRVVTLNQLCFKIQIDRIDSLIGPDIPPDTAQHIVIDYKTGVEQSLEHWFDERLTDPQLPLYALFATAQIHGLAYAAVHPQYLHFRGLTDSTPFSKVQSIKTYFKNTYTWEDITQIWYKKLCALSDAFFHGEATVAPVEPSLCERCHLPSLCRIRAQHV